MVSIRPMKVNDLICVQSTNQICLPENYQQKYFMYHLTSWPGISFVAEDIARRRVVGYVLAKMDEEDPTKKPHGHITSLAVQRSYRRRGIAQRLMEQASQGMIMLFNCDSVTLHVRASNRAAYSLYADVLKFKMIDREVGYYADGEDGLFMKRDLVHHALLNGIQPAERNSFFDGCRLEHMIEHNAQHQNCSVSGVCRLEPGMTKLSNQEIATSTMVDAKLVASSSASSSPTSTTPTRSRTRSSADTAMAARFKSRKDKMRKAVSNKTKESDPKPDAGASSGLNIVTT